MARVWANLTLEEVLALEQLEWLSNNTDVIKDNAGIISWLKHNRSASTAPTTTDDSWSWYAVWSRWIDTTADKEYVCLDATVSSAVWTETTQSWWGWGWWWAILSWVISWPQVVWTVMTVPVNQTISATTFRISLAVQPAGQNFIVELFKNWVSEWTATITTAQSATNGLYQATLSSFTSWAYSAGDVLSVEINQIWTTVVGSWFTFNLT